MILRIEEGVSKIGVRLKAIKHKAYLADWRRLVLVVLPGQLDNVCGPNGSPFYLCGCWWGKPIGVDIANPPAPDFPAITIPATGTNDDCEVEFRLPQRFKDLPFGRYTGMVQHIPSLPDPCEPPPIKIRRKHPPKCWPLDMLPPLYVRWQPCCPPDLAPKPEPPRACVLATFDIDYGMRCGDHIVDHASVTLSQPWCDPDAC